jgi:putative ABC transport system permease protein
VVWQTLLESLRGLQRSGRRAWLALFGIAVGSACVVALLTLGNSAASEARRAFEGLGSDLLMVNFDEDGLPRQVGVERLAQTLDGVTQAASLAFHSARVSHRGAAVEPSVLGTTAGLASVLGIGLQAGRFISPFERREAFAVVGAQVARDLAEPGRPLHVGDRLQIEQSLFEIIGIAAAVPPSPSLNFSLDRSILIPLQSLERLRAAAPVASLIVQTDGVTDLSLVAARLHKALGEGVEVQIPRQLLDAIERQSATFSWLLSGLGAIALLVGGAGVMNVMLISVSERRREIGLRMALGARPGDIRNLFLFEAAGLSLTGAVLGAASGVLLAQVFCFYSGWPFRLDAGTVPLGVGSALLVGIFFGLRPALTAARLQPVQALRDD